MDDIADLLTTAAHEAVAFRESLATRPVAPSGDAEATLAGFAGALPAEPTPAPEVVRELVAAAAPGLMGSAGPRFFGFVVGGALPAATAADILATGWDQCAFNAVLSPAAAVAEQVAGTWLKELLGIPSTSSVGFATGAQGANTVGLAA